MGATIKIHELNDEQRTDWLQLIRSDGIGPITFHQLVARFGSAAAAIEALPTLGKGGQKRLNLAARKIAVREIERTQAFGAKLVAACEPSYPPALREIADPPPMISLFGSLDLSRRSIAIVGARNASAIGRRMATELARGLADEGLVIVSGLARGIDGAAHAAALHTGTIAVLAGGVDQVYPPEHTGLYRSIAEEGVVISEVQFGHVARAQDFPKRNRIVSGLSSGVIIVEAAERSGTLITARLAAEQGRDVFAVPGSPLDPRSAGTNRLIRQGATLIRNADDVLDGLGRLHGIAEPFTPYSDVDHSHPTQDDRRVLSQELIALLSYTPIHRDELVRETGAPVSHVGDTLLDLVLKGIVEEVSGGSYTLPANAADSRSSI